MNRSYLFNVTLRIIIIAGFAAVLSVVILKHYSPFLIGVSALLLIFSVISAIRYQNKINAQIAYFFEAVRNEDFSLNIPSKGENKITRELVQNLNRVNRQIQDIVISNYQQEQYFKKLIEQLETGVLTYDENEHIIHANREVKKILGMQQLTHLRQIQNVSQSLYQKLKTFGDNGQKNIQVQTPGGEIDLLVRSTDIKNQGQHLHLLTIQDIKRELDAKETDSWIKLIRVLTHEMMNSIAPVVSLSDTLSNSFKQDGSAIDPGQVDKPMIERTIQGFEIIKEQGQGIIQFVESYRQLTTLPKPNKKNVNINTLIDRVMLLYDGLHKNISIKNHCNSFSCEILLDENQISQVLGNLIKNSIEAIGDSKEGEILIESEQMGDKTEIRVIDNGCGIPVEKQSEIFVPFFTTKEKGNGIGLSLSRQIMQMHNGRIICHSVLGKGTRFSLQFPRNTK